MEIFYTFCSLYLVANQYIFRTTQLFPAFDCFMSGFSACIHHITLPKHYKYISRPATGIVRGEDGRCGVRRWDRCAYHRFNLDSDSRAHHRPVARNRPNKVRNHSYISCGAHRHTGFSVLPARP